MTDRIHTSNERSIAEVLREMKSEALAFLNTRFELLVAELKEKSSIWKKSVPMLMLAVIFSMGAFATFTFTLVSGLAILIGTPYAWTWGFLIVCCTYAGIGATLGVTGYKRLTAQSLAPERTIRVLKQDQQWIKEETRAA